LSLSAGVLGGPYPGSAASLGRRGQRLIVRGAVNSGDGEGPWKSRFCMGTQTEVSALRAARSLLAVNGGLWLVLGAVSAMRLGIDPGLPPLLIPMMLGNAAVLLVLARWLNRPSAAGVLTAAVWVALNLVLSVTDQLGTWDVLVALLNFVTLALLAAVWKTARSQPPSG